jgi:hypothetical protein
MKVAEAGFAKCHLVRGETVCDDALCLERLGGGEIDMDDAGRFEDGQLDIALEPVASSGLVYSIRRSTGTPSARANFFRNPAGPLRRPVSISDR